VKVQGNHTNNKNMPWLLERHFPKRIPPWKKARPTKRCAVCYKKINGRRQCSGVLTVTLHFVLILFQDIPHHAKYLECDFTAYP
jgi:hypothetical protein